MAPTTTLTKTVHLALRAGFGFGLGLWILMGVQDVAGVALQPLPLIGAVLCGMGAAFGDRPALRRLGPAVAAVVAAHVVMSLVALLSDLAGTTVGASVILAAGAAAAVAAVRLQPRLTLSLATERTRAD
jgi:hypothetical protein